MAVCTNKVPTNCTVNINDLKPEDFCESVSTPKTFIKTATPNCDNLASNNYSTYTGADIMNGITYAQQMLLKYKCCQKNKELKAKDSKDRSNLIGWRLLSCHAIRSLSRKCETWWASI